VPDRYAAGASMGLAVYVSTHGIERLGVCQAPLCGKVYFDTTANRSRRHCSDRCADRSNTAYRARRQESAEAEIGSRERGR
jgi:predicted RNA-binding Zn ribbon-like protein